MTQKQANIIYRNAKLGNIKVEKWMMKDIYDTVDVIWGTWNYQSMTEYHDNISHIISDLLSGNFERAQQTINFMYDFERLSKKNQQTFDRTLIA